MIAPISGSCSVCLCALVAFGSGCSRTTELDRTHVSGSVALDGAPVEKGVISFLPVAGHTGPSATAVIEAGQYRLGGEEGPVAGPHLVVVLLDSDDKAAFLSQRGHPPPKPRPPSRNRWEFQVEVPPTGDFEYNVELE
jgi:hypothetical protein